MKNSILNKEGSYKLYTRKYDMSFMKLIGLSSGDAEERKDFTNKLALGVLAVLLCVIFVTYAAERVKLINEINETEKLVNKVAEGMSKYDTQVMSKWAFGEYQDSWGKSPYLIINTSKGGTQIGSNGPDKKYGNEDDVKSRVYEWSATRRAKDKKEEIEDIVDETVDEYKEKIEDEAEGITDSIKKKWNDLWGEPK
jgi:hypothetical protein